MAPNPKIAKAFRAMREIGIDEETVKPVLKNLLKLYDKNWKLIEEENYRALADAIFDCQESNAAEQKKKPEEANHDEFLNEADESERPLKRLRLRHQGPETSSSPQRCSIEQSQEIIVSTLPNLSTESQPVSYHHDLRPRRKQPVSPQASAMKRLEPVSPSSQVRPSDERNELLPAPILRRENRSASPNLSHGLQLREPKTEPNIALLPKKRPGMLIKPKNEPITINDDVLHFEVPIAILSPDPSCQVTSSSDYTASQQADIQENPASHCVDGRDNGERGNASSSERENNHELANIADESPPHIDIASSPLGEVKISLICNPVHGKSRFPMPSLAEILKFVEEKCLKTSKISDPNFVMNLMRDMCEACLELGTESTNELENTTDARIDSLEKLSGAHDAQGLSGDEEQSSNPDDDSVSIEVAIPEVLKLPPSVSGMDNHVLHNKKYTQNGICGSDGATTIPVSHLMVDVADENSHSMVVFKQHELTPDQLRAFFDRDDISRGEERVKITLVYEINNDPLPSFHYIPNSLVFQTACVNFSLAQVGNEDCCSNCFGNCLSLSKPCACALETGGEFAYTSDGTLKEKFLEESISMKQDPQKQNNFYCKECPVERSTNEDMAEQCKGHLKRKFIKECWSKCGCRKQCGNRVVQRGITGNLQVFMTAGKGWGLRTLEELPKGAFVCEYVGEILTTSELDKRKMQSTSCHSYPVLLDADWGAEMKDDEALCLDATYYGNAARFINHRCLDANMIEIPVEVENSDHHYYHLAFFTTRKVDAMEELTWDYGIDFDDHDNPVKAFLCQCGSTFCRNMKHYTKRYKSNNS